MSMTQTNTTDLYEGNLKLFERPGKLGARIMWKRIKKAINNFLEKLAK